MVVVAPGEIKMEGQGVQMFVVLCIICLTRLINAVVAFFIPHSPISTVRGNSGVNWIDVLNLIIYTKGLTSMIRS